MRVLLNGVAVRGGGVETFLMGLLPELIRLDRSISYDLIVPQSRAHIYRSYCKELRIIEINNNYVENSAKRLLFEHILLLKHHVAHHYDVHFRIDELVSPAFRLISAPTIAIFHATQHMLIPQHIGDSGLKLRYLNTMKSVAMHCATIPVTVSHHAKAELSGLYPFAHEKIHVVYHGVNHDVFRPSKLPYSHNKYQQKFGKYILSVSDRHVHKNYRRLIQAYVSLVKNDCIEEKLVLVGRAKVADEERKIRKLIDGSNLQEKVQLLDYMDQIDIAQLYQGAVAYVFPSLFETFGFTPLEAMACGVPVACSRYSVMPEICGESVQYFDPLDIEDMARGISFVVKDESRRKELIQRGLERASYYSWRRAAEEYYKILMKMDRS